MTDGEIVKRLHEGFRSGTIPRSMPSAPVGVLEGRETIILNGGRGAFCSACGELVPANAEGSIEYRYPTATTRFHRRCDELWMAEREKPIQKKDSRG